MNDPAKTNRSGKLGHSHYTGLVPKLKTTMIVFQNSLSALKIYNLCYMHWQSILEHNLHIKSNAKINFDNEINMHVLLNNVATLLLSISLFKTIICF